MSRLTTAYDRATDFRDEGRGNTSAAEGPAATRTPAANPGQNFRNFPLFLVGKLCHAAASFKVPGVTKMRLERPEFSYPKGQRYADVLTYSQD